MDESKGHSHEHEHKDKDKHKNGKHEKHDKSEKNGSVFVHHRHSDRAEPCEYADECNTPEFRQHKRRDDLDWLPGTSMFKWIASLLGAVISTLVITGVSGLLMTESRIESIISKHPAVVSLQDKVTNISEDLRAANMSNDQWRTTASSKFESIEKTVDRIAYVTGAEVLKPPRTGAAPAKGKKPKSVPNVKIFTDMPKHPPNVAVSAREH